MPHDQCITCEDIGRVAVLGSLQEQLISVSIDRSDHRSDHCSDHRSDQSIVPYYGSSLLDLLIWIRNVASCAIHCSVFCIVINGSDKLN